jgi:uroporphyrinogen-III synthase
MQSLEGFSILVTRPEQQAGGLISAIQAHGGLPLVAPMLAIQAVADDSRAAAVIDAVSDYFGAIFVSRNAVDFGIELLRSHSQSIDHMAVFAVGLGTANRLRELGINNVDTPREDFSSEGLLGMARLSAREVRDRRIIVFRGVGGREHLAETLQSRGALVDYCEVYERTVPTISLAEVLKKHKVEIPDIAVVTSLEGLTNLADKIDAEGLDKLFDMPLAVIGSRIGQEVERLGFTNPPVIVDNPADDKIIHALTLWAVDEL